MLDLSNLKGLYIGDKAVPTHGPQILCKSCIDGQLLATISSASGVDVDNAIDKAHKAFEAWRLVPAPARGEFVRRFGNQLRKHKADLAQIVTMEAGKITSEAMGEVQEMIDICDFAVGLSRQLYGLTIASERPLHRMMEQWHPLGVVGVISAFNFPVAVWAWNAAIAFVCGDSVVWKPSEKTTLCAIACQQILQSVIAESVDLSVPEDLSCVVVGDSNVGEALIANPHVPLVSATGSVRMGKRVAQVVGARLGRSLLELGGNNAMIVTPTAEIELAIRAIIFSAFGTCGQRCTTLRRLIVHRSLFDELLKRLCSISQTLPIGDPREKGVLIGPLIDKQSYDAMQLAIQTAIAQGGSVVGGDRIIEGVPQDGYYVKPAVIAISASAEILQHETFAPILYCMPYDSLDEAVAIQNGVAQGLSSAIFTSDVREAESFLSTSGSDCGIANVNIGTSGAEIGGAFGGEKETGGGRESGSDSWKAYMRRATNTINYSRELPLAQGVNFDF